MNTQSVSTCRTTGARRASADVMPSEEVSQLLLFAQLDDEDEIRVRRTTRRRRKKPKKKIRGLQYRIQLKVRKTPRKIKFRLRTREDEVGNDFDWVHDDCVRMHSALLRESLETLKGMCEKKSPRTAEIVAWMERDAPDEPFSFVHCCRLFHEVIDDEDVGPQDPAVLRQMTRFMIKQAYGSDLPFYRVLRQGVMDAESGDSAAIDWVMDHHSDDKLSFNACCEAMGFDPDVARDQVRMPIPVLDFHEHTLSVAIDAIIDRIFPLQATA